MKLKLLFREYNGTENVVSGTQGSNILIGTGTTFTNYAIGSQINIEGLWNYYKIQSIEDDLHLTIDKNLPDDFENAKYWIDWTAFFMTCGRLSRKVESDSPFESGLITFDKIKLDYLFNETLEMNGTTVYNPVFKAISGKVDSANIYLVQIQVIKKDFFSEPLKLITGDFKSLVDNVGNYLVANFKALQGQEIYEGMIDFTTNNYPDILDSTSGETIKKINFEVLDKLSAIDIVTNITTQRQLIDFSSRSFITDDSLRPYKYIQLTNVKQTNSDASNRPYLKVVALAFNATAERWQTDTNPTAVGTPVNFIDTFTKPGEILRLNKGNNVYDNYLVLKSTLETRGAQMSGSLLPGVVVNMLQLLPINISTFGFGRTTCQYVYDASSQGAYNPEYAESNDIATNVYMIHCQGIFKNSNCYSAEYYGKDIGIYDETGLVLISFDAVKMLAAIYAQIWNDVTIINRTGSEKFPISLSYYGKTIDENPFEQHPLDASKYLINSMLSYIYNNNNGNLIIQNRNGLSDLNPDDDLEIPYQNVESMSKNDFWDKLNDAVTVNVNSWTYDETTQNYLIGTATVSKRPNIQPRNLLTLQVFIDGQSIERYGMSIDANGKLVDSALPTGTQQEILNHYALLKAQDFFDFYGKRHESYDISLIGITWDMLKWDLLNIFSKNGKRYFVTKLDFDILLNKLDMELVSIDGYDYDIGTIVIGQSNAETTNSLSFVDSNGNIVYGITSWSGDPSGLNPALGKKSLQLDKDHSVNLGNVNLTSLTVTNNYTLVKEINTILCDCNSNDITITLPDPTANKDVEFLIHKIDSSTNKVIFSGTISGMTDVKLFKQYDDIRIKSNGTSWLKIGKLNSTNECTADPRGVTTPRYFGEEILDTTHNITYSSTGLTTADWIQTSITAKNAAVASGLSGDTNFIKGGSGDGAGAGGDIDLTPGAKGSSGSDGNVIIKQPGTQKSDNKYLQLWHDGANGFIKTLAGYLINLGKFIVRDSANPTDATKQIEILHDGIDAKIESKLGLFKIVGTKIRAILASDITKYVELWHDGINAHVTPSGGVTKINILEGENAASGSNTNGSDLVLAGGDGDGSGVKGNVVIKGLSIADKTTITKILAFDLGAIAASTTRTITFPNANIDLTYLTQDLRITGSPTFANITDSGLTASQIVQTDTNKKLVSAAMNTGYNLVVGTGSNQVAAGNHTHSAYAPLLSPSFTTPSLGSAVAYTLTFNSGSADVGFLSWNGSYFIMAAQTGRGLSLGANGSSGMFNITTTGEILIGTTTPTGGATKLTVNGAVSISGVVAIGNTVNTVNPTSPNRTITIVVGGVTLYIPAKTTND
jgi:hypothetical protein